jgi:hypothetical protein
LIGSAGDGDPLEAFEECFVEGNGFGGSRVRTHGDIKCL